MRGKDRSDFFPAQKDSVLPFLERGAIYGFGFVDVGLGLDDIGAGFED